MLGTHRFAQPTNYALHHSFAPFPGGEGQDEGGSVNPGLMPPHPSPLPHMAERVMNVFLLVEFFTVISK